MKYIPSITACVGGLIGIVLGMGEREGPFIAGICAAGAYLIGVLIAFLLTRSADNQARQAGSEYSPEQWEQYKENMKK